MPHEPASPSSSPLSDAAPTRIGGEGRPAEPRAGAPGESIGPFRLLELIGEGGFGEVWLAEQRTPIARRVALKIIKLGMDTRHVIARFEAERQALALMSHPNIARVLDAGTTDRGRPFFVMEHVRGEPITAYCDRHRLTVRQRIELFAPVCDAVQHAHTKGIIHRDLKPSNILVTVAEGGSGPAAARPVIIDFGVAKAIARPLTERTIYTEQGQLIGTPEYMSPEQAEMSETDIDTRTDVYSLGVILYELLTGALPFDPKSLRSAGYSAIQRIIREVEPPRPSTRLSSMGADAQKAADARHARLEDLSRQLRGELEWIPLKCLRKDRTERYRTAAELGDDIANYLAHRPLIAGPESTAYQLRKLLRRHRGPAAAIAAVAVALVAGLAGTIWQANRASTQAKEARLAESEQRRAAEAAATARKEAENRRAEAETARAAEARSRSRAEAISQFVTKALFASDPTRGGKQDVTVIDAMRSAVKELDSGTFKDDPRTEADLRDTIARVLQANGRATEAEPLFAQALEIQERLNPAESEEVATALNRLAKARERIGRVKEAEPLFRKALDIRRKLHTGDHPDLATSLNNLGYVLVALGRAREAEPIYAEALDMRRRLYTGDHADLATGLNNVAHTLQILGREREAEPLYVEALEMRRRLFQGDHHDLVTSICNLAGIKHATGRAEEALPLFEQALEMQQRLFKGDHPDVAMLINNVAGAKNSLGRREEAEALFQQALEMYQRIYKGDHPQVAIGLSNLAGLRLALGRNEDAAPLYAESIEMCRRLYPGDHPSTVRSLSGLALCRSNQGKKEEAATLIDEASEMVLRLYKPDHPLSKQIAERRKKIVGE